MNILAVVVPYIVLLLVTWVRLGLRKVPIPSGGYNIDKHTGSTCCTGYEKDDRIRMYNKAVPTSQKSINMS